MKNAMIMAAAFVIGSLLFFAQGNLPGRAAAQTPAKKAGPKSVTIGELKKALKEMGFLETIEPKGDEPELATALKERHNSAVKLLQERINEYEKGIRDINPVYEAGRLVADAKLDLAADADAKVKILEHTLKVAELAEAYLKQVNEKGLGSRADLERAHYGSLNVKVQLLQAKQKAKAKPD
jgi:hypothetical protein